MRSTIIDSDNLDMSRTSYGYSNSQDLHVEAFIHGTEIQDKHDFISLILKTMLNQRNGYQKVDVIQSKQELTQTNVMANALLKAQANGKSLHSNLSALMWLCLTQFCFQ